MDQPKSNFDSPLLLAALMAADSIPKEVTSAPLDLSPIPKEAPVISSTTELEASGAPIAAIPQLDRGKLWLLQQTITAILPVIHMVPGPEKILVTQGLSVLTTQAPDLLRDLLPAIEEAGRGAKNPNDLRAVIAFCNDSRN
ncbi:hypothetical protein CAEBREN_09558 [Caenorhabditis brenneri]|uniref:Uncharacterized protein n=1 Tax=Caenorhabditis brenneri TaxID=135651 RepID=G0MMI2_CAEBE|nr:hypothetical protein CAEBREN_09558 [Caenorhabditis brenneri]